MAEGWAYYSQALEMDGWMSFCGNKRTGRGYIGQETDKLMEQARHILNK